MFTPHVENGYKTLNLAKRSDIYCSELSREHFGQFSRLLSSTARKSPVSLLTSNLKYMGNNGTEAESVHLAEAEYLPHSKLSVM